MLRGACGRRAAQRCGRRSDGQGAGESSVVKGKLDSGARDSRRALINPAACVRRARACNATHARVCAALFVVATRGRVAP